VLVAGGFNNSGALASAELYNWASNTWSAAGSLATARYSHTAALLPSGQVLVAGGYNGSNVLASAELYDPATNTWSAAGSLTTGRTGHTAARLPSGQVLVAGGWNGSALASAELYTPEVIFRDGFDVP
jgi:N-acetylneuraminic acid mutarotase